jgi:hypothetical protein
VMRYDERNWRATAESHRMERDQAEAESVRLREEWRKADDGWIACREQLEGAVGALKLIACARAESSQHAIDIGLARNALEAMGVDPSLWRTGGEPWEKEKS